MYYPQSQIKLGLFTNGGEFIKISDNSIYIGEYWKISNGEFFSGKGPNDPLAEELIPLPKLTEEAKLSSIKIQQGTETLNSYLNTKNINPNNLPISFSPVYSFTLPTEEEYEIGEFTRYFCKKTNELVYLEISQDIYDKITKQDSSIDYINYEGFDFPWKIKGININQVARDNYKLVFSLEKTGLTGLTLFFKNYAQYYRG